MNIIIIEHINDDDDDDVHDPMVNGYMNKKNFLHSYIEMNDLIVLHHRYYVMIV